MLVLSLIDHWNTAHLHPTIWALDIHFDTTMLHRPRKKQKASPSQFVFAFSGVIKLFRFCSWNFLKMLFSLHKFEENNSFHGNVKKFMMAAAFFLSTRRYFPPPKSLQATETKLTMLYCSSNRTWWEKLARKAILTPIIMMITWGRYARRFSLGGGLTPQVHSGFPIRGGITPPGARRISLGGVGGCPILPSPVEATRALPIAFCSSRINFADLSSTQIYFKFVFADISLRDWPPGSINPDI